MAQLMQPFDARNVDPTQGVGGLPIGKHPVIVHKSEVKPTKEGDGGYLQLELQIIDGPNKGAVGAYRLNLYSNSPVACEIAHKQLSAVCHVTGVYTVNDSAQLHNIPFMIEVGLQKEPNPNKYTEVKRVFDINGNDPGHANGNGQAAQNTGAGQPQQRAAGGWGGQQGQVQQQLQQQPAIADNVAMPEQQPQQQGQPAWGQAQGGGQPQPQAQQQQPAWGQNNNAPANNGQPAWGQR